MSAYGKRNWRGYLINEILLFSLSPANFNLREIKEITIGTDGLHLKAIKLEDARILVKGAENVCEESIKVRLKRQDFKLAHEDRLDRELQTERDLIQTALNSIDQLMEQIDNQVRIKLVASM